MSRNLGPTTEILLRRVRQYGGFALTPSFALEIYSRCEQLTNAATRRVLSSSSLSIPKQQLLFNFRDSLPSAIEITNITESNRKLSQILSLGDLASYDITWFRNITSDRFESWSQIGRDILIIYPGKATASSVNVEYVKLLTLYDDFTAHYNTASELPDEDVDLALGLAEIICLLRFRLLAHIPARLQSIVTLFDRRGIKLT